MEYLSRRQMKEADRIAIEEFGIPALLLMENAGRIVAEETARLIRGRHRRILVICGKGNNGGDGLVAARYLHLAGIRVDIILLDSLTSPSRTPETQTNLDIVRKLHIPMTVFPGKLFHPEIIGTEFIPPLAGLRLRRYGVIIDAIFGIGLEREVRPPYLEIIEAVNTSKVPVVAIDIPSGLDADTGRARSVSGVPNEASGLGAAIKAKVTVTMAVPKKAFRNRLSRAYTGRVIIADIGIPAKAIALACRKK